MVEPIAAGDVAALACIGIVVFVDVAFLDPFFFEQGLRIPGEFRPGPREIIFPKAQVDEKVERRPEPRT